MVGDDERSLIDAAAAGDNDAFTKFDERYQKPILQSLLSSPRESWRRGRRVPGSICEASWRAGKVRSAAPIHTLVVRDG